MHAHLWTVVKVTTTALGIGLLNHVLTMGCFQSSPAKTESTNKSHIPVHQTTSPDTTIRRPEAEIDADASGQVVSVPRAAVTVGQRERAELRVKNLRDKLSSSIAQSEQVMQDEGRLALKFRKEGREASARILIQRRQLLKNKIARAETQLSTVYDMIEGLEQAQDNKNLMLAIEQGTQAINDITKDVSVDRMQSVLADNREAIQYVETLGDILKSEAQDIDAGFDYDAAFEQLEDEQLEEQSTGATAAVQAIPDVPAVSPIEPQAVPAQPHSPPTEAVLSGPMS